MSASIRIKNIWSIKKLFVYSIVIAFLFLFARPVNATDVFLGYQHVTKLEVYGSVVLVQFSENTLARCSGGWQLIIPNLTEQKNCAMFSVLLAAKLTSGSVDVVYANYNPNPSDCSYLAIMVGCGPT
jgi:hypothetical protein